MLSYDVPKYQFQKLGMDICQFASKDYLVICDFYSRYINILLLRNKTANEIISKLKDCFAVHGITREIISGNVPFNIFTFKQRVVKQNYGFLY